MNDIDDNKSRSIAVPQGENACWVGWTAVVDRLQSAITERCSSKPILVVECYPGVDAEPIFHELQQRLKPTLACRTSTVFHQSQRIEKLTQPYVDESKSRSAPKHMLTLPEFFDAERLWHARREIEDLREGFVLIVGCGASLIAWGHVLVYAELTRWKARAQLSRGDHANLGLENHGHPVQEKLRIASLVDWPVADRWKRPLITHWDFALETKPDEAPTLFDGEAVQRALQLAVQRPFRFAPHNTSEHSNPPGFQKVHGSELIPSNNNANTISGWQEESLRLSFGTNQLELPALDLLMFQPRTLLGDAAFLRFGLNCPLPLFPHEPPAGSYEPLHDGEGWSEERLVLPRERSGIAMRRLLFTRGVQQHTNGSMLVLELVNGPKLSVESPTEAFAPLVFRRDETFIVPAAVGEFILRPGGLTEGRAWTVFKAFVQTR